MKNIEIQRQQVNEMLGEHTPADKLSTMFNLWIHEEFENWFDNILEGNDEDKRRYVNILADEEMDFMLDRFQNTLEDCINQYGKEV